MKLTILGGCAAWPTARQACGGYLVEHDGHTLLIDPGFGVLPRLLALGRITDVDAVLVTHGHLDHCADLLPLLRARTLGGVSLAALPVFAPHRALDGLFAAERIRFVARGADLTDLGDGTTVELGPFTIEAALLPHHVVNAGLRISTPDRVLSYTGDSGNCSERITLAKGADLLLAEATYVGDVPDEEAPYLSSAQQVAELALAADARSTVLTHQWPGQSAERALAAARRSGLRTARVAFAGMTVDLDPVLPRQPRSRRGTGDDQRDVPVLPRRAAG